MTSGRGTAVPRTLRLVLLLAVVGAAPALAHHSFAMYDHTGTLTLKGEVTRFQWTNPHAYLELDVPQDDGTRKHYTLEMTSINMMQRQGWRSSTIKAGDKVKAVMAPLLSGQAGGLLLEVTLPDGRVLEPGVPAAASYRRTLDREEGR